MGRNQGSTIKRQTKENEKVLCSIALSKYEDK